MINTSFRALAVPCTRGRAIRYTAALVAAFVLSALAVDGHARDAQQSKALSAQLHASPSQVRLVQEKLRKAGHDPGRVDGAWGESTEEAVRDFQKDNELAVTGQLDTSLLSALEIGGVLEGETSSGFLDGLLSSERAGAASSAGTGTPIYVSPAHVAQIQHVLHEQGHYSGSIDGAWGRATAQAANKYRQANGLEANDSLDIALLQALNQQRAGVPQLAAEVSARTEGVPLHPGAATVRAMQRELSKQGHESGAVDGEWGENTRQALREFQREHDLESTGTLTLPTLAALGIDITNARQQEDFEARTRSGGAAETDQDQDAVAETEEN